jgi:hypothetical protein
VTIARFGHTATLLANGKVLIAGDVVGADIYDPATGRFDPTGNMVIPRAFGVSATLLPDGRVLFAGGSITKSGGMTSNTASAELYDTLTGTFAATGSLFTAKGCPAALLLPSGKGLVVGGWAPWFVPQEPASAELYDPATGTFAAAGPYSNSSPKINEDIGLCPNSFLLPDGRALIVWDDLDSTVEIYDPDTNTFRLAGRAIRPPGLISPATLLISGKVLFAGGTDGETAFGYDSAELYDPATGASSQAGTMTTGRFGHTATLLPDGTVLIAGSQRSGYDGASAISSAEIYDPATGTFAETGSMLTPRFGHTATLLPDGTVLITGGTADGSAAGAPGAKAEIYHPNFRPNTH